MDYEDFELLNECLENIEDENLDVSNQEHSLDIEENLEVFYGFLTFKIQACKKTSKNEISNF